MSKRKLTAVPAQRMSPKMYTWVRRTIIASIVVAMLAGPLAIILTARANDEPVSVAASSFPSQIIAFSEKVATDWLSGECTTMPVTSSVDSCFGRQTNDRGKAVPHDTFTFHSGSTESVPDAGENITTVYVTSFQVNQGGKVYRLHVTTRLVRTVAGGALRPVLAAEPSFIISSLAPSDAAPAVDYADSVGSESPTVQLRQVLENWAQAYASDDRDQLRLIVAGGPSGEYPGIGGASAERVQVSSVIPRVVDENSVVQVDVTFAGEEWVAKSSFDLLIDDPFTPTPKVLAWGPAGKGISLVPYQNNLSSL